MTTAVRVLNDGQGKKLKVTPIDPGTGEPMTTGYPVIVVEPQGISAACQQYVHSGASLRIDEVEG